LGGVYLLLENEQKIYVHLHSTQLMFALLNLYIFICIYMYVNNKKIVDF